MAERATSRPTESELEILRVLWQKGPSTVRDVHEILSVTRSAGYTGILKLMQIMAEKGLVIRDESNRSHIYAAAIREEHSQKQLVRDLLTSAFRGATDKLVMQALSAKKVTDEELAEIRRILDDLEHKRKS